ncbi:hypothetical protein [Hymenobacter psychrophilus]|uniref:Uncharacterized protein n=1 Tax=Hymenobacter psychrophilus TaxID=651662 RepID=A0A1H3LVW0_9BACT|nr:hypothetical protein [Hymenobacter psychrophilus]SDY68128.1 hypothetical protein SAMN04488069_111142 [Hymenobacter psychrophilus]
MKHFFALLTLLLLALQSRAQAPSQFSYQAVIRDDRNRVVDRREVAIKVSILQGSETGMPVYEETHRPTTNENGLVTLAIGGGTVVSGVFTKIEWPEDSFFLKTEIDPNGNGNPSSNVIRATSRLLTVPYAIYAQRSDSSRYAQRSDSTRFATYADAVRGHQIGDLYGGGIIFSLWRDQKGVQHGLIASLKDVGIRTWATPQIQTLRAAESHVDGAANTKAIIAQAGANSAAGVAAAYAGGMVRDWYLPSSLELRLLYDQSVAINAILERDNDPLTTGLMYEAYWSSTIAEDEITSGGRIETNAFRLRTIDNEEFPAVKPAGQDDNDVAVRAIRRF